ncbi:MAG: hypothetical protein KAQ98_04875 [Bacteriovoracaceae bacterium]|nr:hypothetical protein [Bacteriovoracaceae bacterium]
MRIILVLCFLACFFNLSFAGNPEQSINYEPLSIDGTHVTKKETASDRMKKLRARLEKQNELLVRKKIELLRLRKEFALQKRIEKMFENQMQTSGKLN